MTSRTSGWSSVRATPPPPALETQGGFFGDMHEEIRFGLLIGLLEIAIGAHALETGFLQKLAHVVLADRTEVERVFGTVVRRSI